jgi:prepilin-type N-terminal cleavage/methylation domain-containing protein
MNKRALTLMEIIVSLTILSITMAGLLNVFISAKKHSLRSRSRVSAGELAKYFLDPLHMQVRQDQWGSNCLSSNPTSGCPTAQSIGNMTYTPFYCMDCSDSDTVCINKCKTNPSATTYHGGTVEGTTLRRVRVDITWTTR